MTLIYHSNQNVMTNSYTQASKASTQSQVALHLMINQLSVSTLPTAIRRENVVVNDIPAALYVHTDAHKLAAVIGSLLNTVIGHSKNSYIRVSAKSYGDVTLVHIKDNGRLNSPAFAGSLIEIQQLAERIGGSVSVTSYRNDVTTVALSFVNLPAAA
jgi:nitrate/nitrite-specific signal transduction histidine kinase